MQKWKIGMIVSASGGPVGRLTGTTTVPMKWPEQSLKLVSQDLSPGVTVSYKSFGTATQMVVNIPRVAEGKEVHAILTVEVTRHTLLPPDETDLYVVPDAKIAAAGLQAIPQPQSADREQSHADQGHRQATRRGPDQGLAPRPRDLRLGPQDDPVPEGRAR